MKKIENLKLSVNASIKEALEIIDTGAIRIAIVVDDNEKVLGTITDGDIRRGFLRGLDLTSSIQDIYFKKPTLANINDSKEVYYSKSFIKKALSDSYC